MAPSPLVTVERGPEIEVSPEDGDLPPIVARMVIEIRSDGSRTIARGALEDRVSGERVALRADASTPLALASELTKALFKMPILAKQAVLGLLPTSRPWRR